MSQQQTITWSTHEFRVYKPDVNWSEASGVYIFSMRNDNGRWVALYIGQADSFKKRFSNHEKWDGALRRGMTHVHAKSVGKQSDRDAIEEELIKKYKPPMNIQLK